jgi:hypothetical protein
MSGVPGQRTTVASPSDGTTTVVPAGATTTVLRSVEPQAASISGNSTIRQIERIGASPFILKQNVAPLPTFRLDGGA